jgi:hypothetical protein
MVYKINISSELIYTIIDTINNLPRDHEVRKLSPSFSK